VSFIFGYAPFFNVGDLGVRIFFVISGFLITGLLVDEFERSESISLTRFYFRRTLRIFPPYYFFLLVFVALAVLGKIHLTFSQFLPVFAYASDYVFPGDWNLDHAWSLSVEEQFYLIYPGVLVLCGMRRIKWLLAAVIIACPILRVIDHNLFISAHPIWLTKGFHANVDTLAAGCLLALLRPRLHANAAYLKVISSKAMFLLPVAIFLLNAGIDYADLDLGIAFSINNILIALFIDWAVTISSGIVGRFLNSWPMVFIGMMSYSIYLWQQPFFDPQPPSKYFAFPYNLIGFVAACCISYFVVERLALRARKRLEASIFRASQKVVLPRAGLIAVPEIE
jgi:peptidoglycan/LPS O-acetylase OafA/YrhL